MSEDLEALRETIMSSLSKCAENSILYLGEERTETLNKLRSHVAAYCKLDVQQKVARNALDLAKQETDIKHIDSLDDKFKTHLQSMANNECNIETHPYMQQFNKKMTRALERQRERDDGDEDLAMTQSSNQYIDPITKKPIQNPVKNKRCGHIYEEETIMELIRTRRRMKCPVAGCGDKTPLTEADIISDEELRFRITLTHHSTMVQNGSMLQL